MNQKLRIAMIGGTGKAGKYVLEQLLIQNYRVKILLRNPGNFQIKNDLLEIVKGDARDAAVIRGLVKGCDAVISTIGQPVGEPTIFCDATKNIMAAMAEFGARRYIVTTGLNVDTPSDQKNPKVAAATAWMHQHYPKTTADKQVEFWLLSASTLDWTLIRLPLIEQTTVRGTIVTSLTDCQGEKISATDLAHFIVNQLTDTGFIMKAPFVSNS